MKRSFKLIASRGGEIIFDGRLQADNPREARQQMKTLLGLRSLAGVVYSITEIPVELIREIVDARIAELADGAPMATSVPADVEALVMEHLKPILRRIAALEQTPSAVERPTRFDPLAILPDVPPPPLLPPSPPRNWDLVKRHLRRYRDPQKTAAKYGLSVGELNAQARREGWLA